MEKEIHEKLKLVTYWLTREESTDQAIQTQIKADSQQYKRKKYKVAVFHSGKEPLYDNTLAFLKHNHRNSHKHSTIQAKI